MKTDTNDKIPLDSRNPAGTLKAQLAAITEQALRAADFDPDYFTLKIATHGALLVKTENLREIRIAEAVFISDIPILEHWRQVLNAHVVKEAPLYAAH